MVRDALVTVEAIDDYPDRIDVRSPAEFAEDHLPGASSHPVLDDAERARVGTIHKQESAFAAKKVGAALVARNIAHWLETAFRDKGREWRPLVYCWRGGKRSGAMTHVLAEIGWKAVQLDGGYRAYRRRVVADLAALPADLRFVVVCGLTGSGKSRLLGALRELAPEGAQVLDLEDLACHRGSLLGDLPGEPQPSQKGFESRIREALRRFDPRRPVYVEAESRKIGSVQVPDALIARMRAGACVRIEASTALRVALLREEYAHFLADPGALRARLGHLTEIHGRARIAEWEQLAAAGDWDALVGSLLERHYDPTYDRSMRRNYSEYEAATVSTVHDISAPAYARLARELFRHFNVPDRGHPDARAALSHP
jgi:tRNA 2-selenouridine synthase